VWTIAATFSGFEEKEHKREREEKRLQNILFFPSSVVTIFARIQGSHSIDSLIIINKVIFIFVIVVKVETSRVSA